MTEAISKKKLLIISHDTIGSSMAGPGIRYHYMGEVLSSTFDVTIGFFDASYLPDDKFKRSYEVRHIDAYKFEPSFAGYQIVIAHWLSDSMVNYCNQKAIFMVFDLYVPGPVENLAATLFNMLPVKRENDFEFNRSIKMYQTFFDNGDLFLFSNQRQLDFWTGFVFGGKHVHLSSYPKRPFYDRFIYAPMGIDTKYPLKHSKNVMKGAVKGIKASDKVLLWTGGVWEHFDAQTLIKAMAALKDERPDIKLFFFGTEHPNPNVKEPNELIATKQLADVFELTGKTVFFQKGWVKYSDRINYLLEADAAVSTHKASIETEFAHRTRILDHLLAGLPTVSTQGDYFSDSVISPDKLGITVPPYDPIALAEAIKDIVEPDRNQRIRQRLANIRDRYDWTQTLKPLQDFLLIDPLKLDRIGSRRIGDRNRGLHFAKKVIPVPIKKIIIRVLRLR